ncbi:hypothetical protein Len3610_18630 [Lentibacillus sp. CBA3610]|nr:hypothetical protein Len3610_18630 [Lentibacillus sp. CBA3610]
MNEKTREEIALFRYGLIAPLLNGHMEAKEYFQELEGKIHQVPYYGERKVAAKTMQEWLLHYRRTGFDALKQKTFRSRNSQEICPG